MKNNYESFHQEIELSNGEALIMSNPIKLEFPKPTELQQNILSTLASFVTLSYTKSNSNSNGNGRDAGQKGSGSAMQNGGSVGKQFLPVPN